MYAAPLLFGLLLELLSGDVLDEGACDADQEVLLDDLPGSHAFAEHEELSLLLVLYVFGEEDDPEVVDSALDFGLGLLEIKEFVDVLHVRDGLLRVSDDDNLVVLGWQDPFDSCDFVELWNFFFYIYHI
jgi:hypothetical protein